MKINELLEENYDTSKARIDHPEDLVLYGKRGIQTAIASLKSALSDSNSASFKPDGKPAIKWGRINGEFVMGDKFMNPVPRSPEDIAAVLSARRGGGREDLIGLYSAIWKTFEASVPRIDGLLFGDLMYTSTPPMKNGVFVIKPNTVTYTVNSNSELGGKIAKSSAGIVVHTYLPAGSSVGKHIKDIEQIPGVIPTGKLLIMDDKIGAAPQTSPPSSVSKLDGLTGRYGNDIEKMLDDQTLTQLKIKALPGLLLKYINSRVRDRSFENIASGFLEWVKPNSSAAMGQKIIEHLSQNQRGLTGFFTAFTEISSVKNEIVDYLDSHSGDLVAHTGDDPGHEGYVVHSKTGPIKLVNRFKFSAANFK